MIINKRLSVYFLLLFLLFAFFPHFSQANNFEELVVEEDAQNPELEEEFQNPEDQDQELSYDEGEEIENDEQKDEELGDEQNPPNIEDEEEDVRMVQALELQEAKQPSPQVARVEAQEAHSYAKARSIRQGTVARQEAHPVPRWERELDFAHAKPVHAEVPTRAMDCSLHP